MIKVKASTSQVDNVYPTTPIATLPPPPPKFRVIGLDIARGIAILLMILSHGIVGLIPFDSLSGWQLVPTHLMTKFASSLFIMVFGFSLGLFYTPSIDLPNWNKRKLRLIFRGLEILIWYKVLTFIQMFQIYDKSSILDALLFIKFPDFVEVLGFYGIFLLWFPFVLRPWLKAPVYFQIILTCVLAYVGHYLNVNWHTTEWTSLKAILVEQEGYFTFGQMQRGSQALLGMILGQLLYRYGIKNQVRVSALIGFLGIVFLGYFFYIAQPNVFHQFVRIASNAGKHPPDQLFMSFSMGGAFIILSLCLLYRKNTPGIFFPIVSIGQKPLQSFIFHIFVIFVLYRYLLDLRHQVPYSKALNLTLLLMLTTFIWTWLVKLKQKHMK